MKDLYYLIHNFIRKQFLFSTYLASQNDILSFRTLDNAHSTEATNAIHTFLEEHNCNSFCVALGLSNVSNSSIQTSRPGPLRISDLYVPSVIEKLGMNSHIHAPEFILVPDTATNTLA